MAKSNVLSVFGDIFADGLLGGEAVVVVAEGGDDGDGGKQRGVESGVHPILTKVSDC